MLTLFMSKGVDYLSVWVSNAQRQPQLSKGARSLVVSRISVCAGRSRSALAWIVSALLILKDRLDGRLDAVDSTLRRCDLFDVLPSS